jgi:hypothetical protein
VVGIFQWGMCIGVRGVVSLCRQQMLSDASEPENFNMLLFSGLVMCEPTTSSAWNRRAVVSSQKALNSRTKGRIPIHLEAVFLVQTFLTVAGIVQTHGGFGLQKFSLIHTNFKLFHVELLYFKTSVLKLAEGNLHNHHMCRLDFEIPSYNVANTHPYKDYVSGSILKKKGIIKHVIIAMRVYAWQGILFVNTRLNNHQIMIRRCLTSRFAKEKNASVDLQTLTKLSPL